MRFQTLEVSEENALIRVVINRVNHKNSLNNTLINEFNELLDYVKEDQNIKIMLIEGKGGYFCTGMDFGIIASEKTGSDGYETEESATDLLTQKYMGLLERLSAEPIVTIGVVDGQVLAGGVGLVAACDFAIATRNSSFSLSEALWGLMPCMVMPYLIRKSGFQAAKRMTLTTLPLDATEAERIRLIDEVTDNLIITQNKLCQRIKKLDKETIGNIKNYLNKMEDISQEKRDYAVYETSKLFNSPKVLENITNYVKYSIFPWENH